MVCISAAGVCALSAVVGACSGGRGKGLALGNADYLLTVSSLAPDTCFDAAGESVFFTVPFTYALVMTNGNDFLLDHPLVLDGLFPPLHGTRTGNSLVFSGTAILYEASNCSLSVTANGTGTLTSSFVFDLAIPFEVSASTALTGPSNDCGALAHGTLPGSGGLVSFPILGADTKNGLCHFTLAGHAST